MTKNISRGAHLLERFAKTNLYPDSSHTPYEEFWENNGDSFTKPEKGLSDFVVKKICNVRMGILKNIDQSSFLEIFPVLDAALKENPVFCEGLGTLQRIYQIMSTNLDEEDQHSESNFWEPYLKSEIDPKKIAQAVFRSGSLFLMEVEKEINEYLIFLDDRKYIIEILSRHQGPKKLKKLKECYPLLNQKIVFNGSHLSQMVLGAGWQEKLQYFSNSENVTMLKSLGFNGYHLSQMVLGAGWQEKLQYIQRQSDVFQTAAKTDFLIKAFTSKNWRTNVRETLKEQ